MHNFEDVILELNNSTPVLKHLLWHLYELNEKKYLVFYEIDDSPDRPTKIYVGYVGIIENYDKVLEKNKYQMRTQTIDGHPDKSRFICHNEEGPAILFPNSQEEHFFIDGIKRTKEDVSKIKEKNLLKRKVSNLT